MGASRTTELKWTTATKPVPEGYQTVTLYLAVDDAVEAMNGPRPKGSTRASRKAAGEPHE